MHAAARFVERVDGLVGQGAVGEVAVGEAHTGRQGGVGVVHIVVLFVAAAQVLLDFLCGLKYKGYQGYEEYDEEEKMIFGIVRVGEKSLTYGGKICRK